jgi:hypothetical protein
MPSANLDLVRFDLRRLGARGIFRRAGDWIDPEIECVVADGPEAGSWQGRAGLIEAGQVILRAWDDLRNTAEEYRELDTERLPHALQWAWQNERA